MRLFRILLEKLAFAILIVGGIGMLMSMFLGVADVIGTNAFNKPVPGAREVTESTMVLIVFGALAYAQVRRSHIRVELLYTRMPNRVKAAMDLFAHAMAFVFFALMTWQAYVEVGFSIQFGEYTDGIIRFPLWPARITLCAGAALVCLQLLLDIAEDAARIRDGSAPRTSGEAAMIPPVERV